MVITKYHSKGLFGQVTSPDVTRLYLTGPRARKGLRYYSHPTAQRSIRTYDQKYGYTAQLSLSTGYRPGAALAFRRQYRASGLHFSEATPYTAGLTEEKTCFGNQPHSAREHSLLKDTAGRRPLEAGRWLQERLCTLTKPIEDYKEEGPKRIKSQESSWHVGEGAS